jgi:hypothetical protein
MLRIKNWSEFQHYKDRAPPWVKLHHSLLDNFEFHSLPVASKALAPMLWLLASENLDGSISDDLSEVAFRLRTTANDVQTALKPLIDKGFVVSDSNVLADCKQCALPETETETETETEARKPSVSSVKQRNPKHQKPDDVEQSVWDDFVAHRKRKRGSITDLVMQSIQFEADKIGWSLNDALKEIVVCNWQTFKAEYRSKDTTKTETLAQVDF